MVDVRCQCGKILCQHDAYVVIIKCRHCKRSLHIGLRETGGKEQDAVRKYLRAKPSVVNI